MRLKVQTFDNLVKDAKRLINHDGYAEDGAFKVLREMPDHSFFGDYLIKRAISKVITH